MSAGRAQRVCGAEKLFYLALPWQITVEPTPTVQVPPTVVCEATCLQPAFLSPLGSQQLNLDLSTHLQSLLQSWLLSNPNGTKDDFEHPVLKTSPPIAGITGARHHTQSRQCWGWNPELSLNSVGDGTQGFVHTRQALCQLSHCLGSGPRFINPLECGQNKKSHQESSLGLDYEDSKTYTNLKIVWSPGLAKPRTVRNRIGWVRKLGCNASDNCTHFTIFTFVKCKITFYHCY